MATDKDMPSIVREGVARTQGAVDQMARDGEATTYRAADAARSIGNEAADAGRRAADQGADTARSVADTMTEAAGRQSGQLQRALGLSRDAQGEVASKARETMDVMVQCGSVLAGGWQSAVREWLGLAQDVATRNAEGVGALMRSRTVPDFYAAQSSMLKDSVQMVLNRSVKISEMSARTASDAVSKLNAGVDAAAQQADRPV
ncbi:phasin family protein [Azospirillum sp. TSO35-2]|uniref:phasin family protein n=1 Tax=Azospirillum sp. TSO35-2 TaxID=716796 RepID=UPI000D618D27|nr:phasin family protein [Azospirillum sp. TSO35-2]PWC32449.1 hypothetical protein TSO352_17305 [Azospirillum sp. TSO35-2]